jgi:FtsX-like permease family
VPPANHPYVSINAVSEDDLRYLMDRFGLRLVEGRLPRPRTNEVVLSEALAQNRGLHIGDSIGYPVYDRDGCPYEMTIVGLLERDGMWMGFASLEYAQSHELTAGYSPDMLVAPGAEGKDSLDAWLLANVDSTATVVRTYEKERQQIERYRLGMLMVLGVMELLVALIAAMALAILNYIFYSQRRDEFGALHALGRVRGWLTWRAGRETLTATAVAWVIGAALCMGIAVYLQYTMFVPKGLSMDLASIAPWLFTLPIPLAVAAASTSTIAWMLRRLDAVAVIEGR